MARITVEDCLKNVDDRFGLVMLSAKRTKQLYSGADPLVKCENKEIITSLREIAKGYVQPVIPDEAEKKKPVKLIPVTLKDLEDM